MTVIHSDITIVEQLDDIERKRDESVRAQVSIADRLASIRSIVRNAADLLQRARTAGAGEPGPRATRAMLDRLSWQLHEERVDAEVKLDHLRQQLEILSLERARRLAELTPQVGAIVAQLIEAGTRPLTAAKRDGRCAECSSEARPTTISGTALVRCRDCQRFFRGDPES